MRMGPHHLIPGDESAVKGASIRGSSLRRVTAFARPYRVQIIGFLTSILVAALVALAPPLLFRRIVDVSIPQGDRNGIVILTVVLVVLALLDAGFQIIQRWLSSVIGEGLIYDLRVALFAKVQSMPIAFFTRTQTGALVSRLNGDVLGAQQAFTSTLNGVIGNLVSLGAILIAMFSLSWQITVMSLVLVPLFLLPARLIGGRIAALTREQLSLNSDMSTAMTERFNVAGALLVKLYGHTGTDAEAFAARAARVRDTGIRIALSNRVFFSALTLVAGLATALAYGVGGVSAINGGITVGTLLALVALLGRLYAPLTGLANVRVDVMTALVSFERLFEVLDLPSTVQDPERPVAIPDGPLSVAFDHVGFRYPQASEVSLASLESVAKQDTLVENGEVLTDIDFRVSAGEMIALVGPSGAGKTTTAALLPRLYDVTEGMISVNGIDIRNFAQQDLRDAIGVVSQDAHLFHDTIRMNLLYARPEASDAELMRALERAQLGDFMQGLTRGLDTVVGDRGHRLSGGEKQRMAIARVLLKQPRIIILDEATAHLDSESEVAVQAALRTALEGRTSVVIAHRLSTIRDADQIVVIDSGRVVQRGTHDALMALGGLYADLYNSQFSRES